MARRRLLFPITIKRSDDMDPETALNECHNCLTGPVRSVSTAAERLMAYYHWRIKGGYEPPGGDSDAAGLAVRIVEQIDALAAAAQGVVEMD
jgi:hypothetical protein